MLSPVCAKLVSVEPLSVDGVTGWFEFKLAYAVASWLIPAEKSNSVVPLGAVTHFAKVVPSGRASITACSVPSSA